MKRKYPYNLLDFMNIKISEKLTEDQLEGIEYALELLSEDDRELIDKTFRRNENISYEEGENLKKTIHRPMRRIGYMQFGKNGLLKRVEALDKKRGMNGWSLNLGNLDLPVKIHNTLKRTGISCIEELNELLAENKGNEKNISWILSQEDIDEIYRKL